MMMLWHTMYKRVGLAVLLLLNHLTYGQSVTADFHLPAQVCLDENVELINQSANAMRYEWDFCQGDLQRTPFVSTIVNPGGAGGTIVVGIDLIQSEGNWYGFTCSLGSNSLLRLDYGPDLNNASPQITNLGSFGMLHEPQAVKIVRDNNMYYAFVNNRSNNRLVRLALGTTPQTPSEDIVADIVLAGNATPNTGMEVAFDGTDWVVLLTNDYTLTLVRFGSTLSNNPTAADIAETTVFPGSWLIGDVSVIYDGQWYGLAVSFNNAKLFKLQFGSSLFSDPLVEDVTNNGILPNLNPDGVSVVYENNMYQAFVVTTQGNFIRYNFGEHLVNNEPEVTDFDNFGLLRNTLKLKIVRSESRYIAFTTNWLSNDIYRFNFPESCTASTGFSTQQNPWPLQYPVGGTNTVTLFAYAANGMMSSQTRVVHVRDQVSPNLSFTLSGICVQGETQFNPVNQSLTYEWDFGDGNTSYDVNAVHEYASTGDFALTVRGTDSNLCTNTVRDTITIYDSPVASFTVPSGIICTNHELTVTNTTPDAFNGHLTYQWYANDVLQATTRDFNVVFSNDGNQTIKLIAAIPGCMNENEQVVSGVTEGPAVAFSAQGFCETDTTFFTNTTTGTVTGYVWDFGTGTTSTHEHTENLYAETGMYTVVLTASNAAGCNNTATRQIVIRSVPEADFAALAPPFSCSGTPTQFSDQTLPPTDSNLSSWLWNFGDTGSPSNTSLQRNPQHTYATAADYTVSLTVTTNFSCSTTLQKTVTIHQTPAASFTHSALCEDNTITFSDAGTNNIAWNWQIGPGFYTVQNPQHVFNNPGNYDVTLTVTHANNCIGTSTESLTVSPRPDLDFTVSRNCMNQLTEFTGITEESTDPLTGMQWNFDGLETATENPATFTFLSTGTASVTLTTDRESGCSYSLTKVITIEEGPLAAFTASPNTGEAPLMVAFMNTSLRANGYAWRFNDAQQSVSTQASPTFTYLTEGAYLAELVATDAKNCSDTTRQLVEVLAPWKLNLPAPNPGPGMFAVEWRMEEAGTATLLLVDAVGRPIIYQEVISEQGINRIVLNATGQPPGVYILRISHPGRVTSYRLIIAQ